MKNRMHENGMKIKTRAFKFIINFLICLVSLSFCLFATGVELADVVHFEVQEINAEKHQVTLKLVTKDHFKIYKDNLAFELRAHGAFPMILSYTAKPAAKLVLDPFSNKKRFIFENGVLLTLNSNADFTDTDTLWISVQACATDVCLLPSHLILNVEQGAKSRLPESNSSNLTGISENRNSADMEPLSQTQISPKQTREAPYLSSNASAPSESTIAELTLRFLKNGSLFLFPILFLAGLLTNLTPCVYPMIPITLGVMNQFGQSHSRHAKWRLPLIYVFGMIITYSFLGVFVAMTGQVFGFQLANPLFNAFVAGIMLLLGFAMLDAFDLSFLQRLGHKIPFAKKSPVLAVATMGAVSGLVAAPCTGPILSMLLVLIAQTHEPLSGFIYMLCFALGFGAPYVVLGFLSQRIKTLPKMHRTSVIVKIVFACLMFALALYFLKQTFGRTAFALYSMQSSFDTLSIFNFLYVKPERLTVISVLIVFVLFVGIQKPKIKIISKIAYTGVLACLTVLCLWLTLLLSSTFAKPMLHNATESFNDALKTSQIHWQTDLNDALTQARRTNKKVVVDVWAEWCAACLEMEETTWKDPNIIELLNDKYVSVKLDYTQPSKKLSEQLEIWHVLGLPAVLILDPEQSNKPLSLTQGTVSTETLWKKLQ